VSTNDTQALAVNATGSAIMASGGEMPPQVFELFTLALSKGAEGVGALKDLVALQDQMQRRNAELEFSRALAEFQESCPSVNKSSSAKISTRSGANYGFTYAGLEEIIETVRPLLTRLGFSFTFDTEATAQMLKCTCILRHSHGHEMRASFSCPTENASGASAQQKFGGANTYAKRQCLVSVLGLSMTDVDADDPEGTGSKFVTEDQAANIEALLTETGANRAKFLAVCGAKSVAEIPGGAYLMAVNMLQAKRSGGAKS